MTPAIRRARDADRDAVTDIYVGSRLDAGAMFPPFGHTVEQTREFVADVMIGRNEAWVAELDGVAAGVLVLEGDDVYWLHVATAAQSRGVGESLLAHAKSLRPGGLALWTYKSNTRAQRFYERHGFVVVRRTDGADNEDHAPDVRFVWGAHPEGRPAPRV